RKQAAPSLGYIDIDCGRIGFGPCGDTKACEIAAKSGNAPRVAGSREQALVRCQPPGADNERNEAACLERKPGQARTAVRSRRRIVLGDDAGPGDAIVSRQSVRVAEAIFRFVSGVVAVFE